jgi:hypothetical protein
VSRTRRLFRGAGRSAERAGGGEGRAPEEHQKRHETDDTLHIRNSSSISALEKAATVSPTPPVSANDEGVALRGVTRPMADDEGDPDEPSRLDSLRRNHGRTLWVYWSLVTVGTWLVPIRSRSAIPAERLLLR